MADPIQIDPRHSVISVVGGKALAREVAKAIGYAAQKSARAQGGRSFWGQVANSVNAGNPDSTPNGWLVGATHVAGAHKQFGGVIAAPGKGAGSRHRKFLTIPVGKAREKRWTVDQAETQGGYTLFQVKAKFGKAFLVGYKEGAKKRKLEILFILKRSVWQRAYPWWPEGPELDRAIDAGIQAHGRKHGGAS